MYQSGGGPKKSRRGLAVALTAVVVLALLGGIGWYALKPDASSGRGAAGSSASNEPSAADAGSLPPKGWQTTFSSSLNGANADKGWWEGNTVDDNTQCEPTPDGLHVVKERQTVAPKTGMYRCDGPQTSFTDVAIQTTVKITNGCAAIWMRTGDQQGYFLDACDNRATLYWVGSTDPSPDNMLGSWPLTAGQLSSPLTLGLVAQGSKLTVWVGDREQQPPVTDNRIKSGEVDLGGYDGDGNDCGVTYQKVTVWTP